MKKKSKNFKDHTIDTIKLSDSGFGKISKALPEYYKRHTKDFWLQCIIDFVAMVIGILVGGPIGGVIGFAIGLIISFVVFDPYRKIKKIRRD